jgi:hypothetical protein
VEDLKQSLNTGFSPQNIDDLMRTKTGEYKDKLSNYDFIKLMLPPNYEIHPNDAIKMQSHTARRYN